jgi:hypothetical protein
MPIIEVKMVTWKILVTASRKESRKKKSRKTTQKVTAPSLNAHKCKDNTQKAHVVPTTMGR